ncbi:hypothetical protein [Methylophilus sp. 14]|uniref:hypothetical protein n=1 Tax=Methylophilus sp. 14 TaxID=2781019 RepID=UPI001E59FFED|nr:hypothetical protein [Methylophilus sp. 14]
MANASLAAEETPQATTIRLPGIYHLWAKDSQDMPAITFDELEQCMSTDTTIRQQFDSFQLETKRMNDEVLNAENLVQANQNARLALEKEANGVQADIVDMNARNDALAKRKQALSAQTRQKVDAETAKKINQQVDQFNKDTLQFNADSSALTEKAQQLKAKQQQFNGSLQDLKNQLDQINAKTSAFNERKKTFNNTLAAYKDKCTGAHKLEK